MSSDGGQGVETAAMGTPQKEEGDPWETGRPEWQARARGLARQWHAGLTLDYDGIDIGRLVEYPMMDMIAREFDAAERTE